MSEIARNALVLSVSAAVALGGMADRLFGNSVARAQSFEGDIPALQGKQLSVNGGGRIGVASSIRLATAEEIARRREACVDAMMEEPEELRMQKIPEIVRKGGTGGLYRLPPLSPHVNLSEVDAAGHPCDDRLVQRNVTLFQKIDGERYPAYLLMIGNGDPDGPRGALALVGSREDQCGHDVQAGVQIQANLNPAFRSGDTSYEPLKIVEERVYLSDPVNVVCKN